MVGDRGVEPRTSRPQTERLTIKTYPRYGWFVKVYSVYLLTLEVSKKYWWGRLCLPFASLYETGRFVRIKCRQYPLLSPLKHQYIQDMKREDSDSSASYLLEFALSRSEGSLVLDTHTILAWPCHLNHCPNSRKRLAPRSELYILSDGF